MSKSKMPEVRTSDREPPRFTFKAVQMILGRLLGMLDGLPLDQAKPDGQTLDANPVWAYSPCPEQT